MKNQDYPQIPPEGNSIEINGIRLYYEIHGQGEPLLLVHGFFGTMSTWFGLLPVFLKHHYQVILVDLRGHGRSTNPSGVFTHRQCADDLYALLDYLKIGRVKAMGISSGGMTLIHMATRQPDRIEKMIPIISTVYFPESARSIMRMSTQESMTPEYFEEMRKKHFYGDDQIRQLRRNFFDFADSYDDMNFTKPFLSTIKAKTLIVHGDRDPFFPIDIAVEMYASIQQSYLFVAPNTGHEEPYLKDDEGNVTGELFARYAVSFLNGEWDTEPSREDL